jgi:uncharacterized protein (DUF58 family)
LDDLGLWLVIIAFAVPAVLTGLIASSKGYSFALFFTAGFFFSLLGTLLVAALLPDRTVPESKRHV